MIMQYSGSKIVLEYIYVKMSQLYIYIIVTTDVTKLENGLSVSNYL